VRPDNDGLKKRQIPPRESEALGIPEDDNSLGGIANAPNHEQRDDGVGKYPLIGYRGKRLGETGLGPDRPSRNPKACRKLSKRRRLGPRSPTVSGKQVIIKTSPREGARTAPTKHHIKSNDSQNGKQRSNRKRNPEVRRHGKASNTPQGNRD